MQIYRLICEQEAGITIDELCTVYCEQCPLPPPEHDIIKASLSRLLSYLLIVERNGCYCSLSINEYMLQSHLKYATPKSEIFPDIEIVNGVIRVRDRDQAQR
ncbi:MAG: hypothetical protein LBV40_08725 [Methanomicrobiales archaeon]|nr:hypothetical protein [Methanomicrobiales archaeon]